MTDPCDKTPHQEMRAEYRQRARQAALPEVRLAQPPAIGQLNWLPLGPTAILRGPSTTHPLISGPVVGVAVADNGRRVYVASVNGGVFRSDDAGRTFYPLMSAFELEPTRGAADSLAVGAFAVHPSRPDRLYVGSGQANTPEPIYGVGPVVSDSGGVDWSTEPCSPPLLARGSLFYGMAVDPMDLDLAVGATDQGLFRRQPRNQDVVGLPTVKPQSYIIEMDRTNGNASAIYWVEDGLGTATAWTGAAGVWNNAQVATTIFMPCVYRGTPRFVRYVPGLGGGNNAWVYEIPPHSEPRQLQALTWTQGLLLLPFAFGGSIYLVQYDTNGGVANNAMLGRWQTDGTLTNVWAAALPWGAGWTALVPFVLSGVPYFLKYNSAAGNATTLWRWSAALVPTQVGGVLNFPNQAQLVPVEVDGEPLLLAYEPNNNGQSTLYRWAADGTITQLWQRIGVIPAGVVLTAFTWLGRQGGVSRLFAYATGTGTTTLYTWGPEHTLVPLWRRLWSPNLIFMPFLIGYEWMDRQANLTPQPLRYDSATRSLVENRRVSSVVSVSNGRTTVFYAAFWADRITDPAVPSIFQGRGQVYVSLDRGMTWEQLGVFPPNQGRITLAVHPANMRLIYATTEAGAVYRYERDSGPDLMCWNPVDGAPLAAVWLDPGSRAIPAIAVSKSDEDILYLGGNKAVLASAGRTVGESGALYRCRLTRGLAGRFEMTATYIGTSLPVGVLGFGISPVEEDLWVATAQGLFHADAPGTTSAAALEVMFEARNTGLSTGLVNGLGQHPLYDAIVFSAGEDGGSQRYAGNEVWINLGRAEDGGAVVVSNDGQVVLVTGRHNTLYRSLHEGSPETFRQVAGPGTAQLPLQDGDAVRLYAPLVRGGTAGPRLAFGTKKPWFSDDFGATWRSLPNNNASDLLPAPIDALGLSDDGTRLYVALENGEVWTFTDSGGLGAPVWGAGRRIDNEGLNPLSAFIAGAPDVRVSAILLDPADAQGDAIYVAVAGNLGGNPLGWQRVWRFRQVLPAPGVWTPCGGPPAGPAAQQLMNISFHTLAGYRAGVNTCLYAGADIGAWYSRDGGSHWMPFGEGLPEAEIRDLQYFPENLALHRPNLLRAATYGRGVYERVLTSPMPANPRVFTNPVQLYMRANVLDRGLYDVEDNVLNPVAPGDVHYWDGIDIKLSAPSNPVFPLPAGAAYTFPMPAQLTFSAFATLPDASTRLINSRAARVYVQVHNRGVLPARGARITILLSGAIAVPGSPPPAPNLPGGFEMYVQNGTPITDPNWRTVAIMAVGEIRAGYPEVISADIPAAWLPGVGTYALVALANSPGDLFTGNNVNVAQLVTTQSKAILKYLTVV